MRIIFTTFLFIIFSASTYSQVYSNKDSHAQNKEERDSLAKLEYHYMLPILGEAAVKKGFKLPLPAGISMQFVTQESDILISNLLVGFNNEEMHNLDQIIRFDAAKSNSQGGFLRPDIWLFPFLNVYGVFGQSSLKTSINAGLWLPDSSNTWSEATSFATEAKFNATTMGFGVTPTMGLWGWWLALDMNFTWNDIAELDKPAFAFVFGPRFGKSIKFSEESNLAFWFGGFRLKLASETSGSLSLGDLFDLEDIDAKLEQGFQKVDNAHQQVDTWWNGLSEAQQNNPINITKYETANNAIEKAGGFLNSLDAAADNIENSTVQYSLSKKPKNAWNFIVGGQYQLNETLMFRAEYGFLGSRNQFLFGVQYRFGF